MSEIVLQHGGQQRGRMFGASAVGTLVIGVVAAVMVIYHFRSPPPVVVRSPPEIKLVEKVVKVPQAPAPPPPAPEPPPPPPPPPPPEEPAPPPATVQVQGVWDGVWRRKEYPLPMFRLMSQSGNTVAGSCAPSWSAVLPFRAGAATGDAVEFVVDDQVFRVHVRMTMVGHDKAKVMQWVSDEDWETSLERAMRAARTPRQAVLARAKLEQDARKFRKPVLVGIFTRQAEE